MVSSDPDGQSPGTSPGLEPAVAVGADQPASQVLAALRETGVKVAVVVDASGRPCRVVPEATLVKAPAGRSVALCKPAWPAATFDEPTTRAERQRNAEAWLSGEHEPPPFGSRTVVVRDGQIMGLIPVPSLFNSPGLAPRLLGRVLTPLLRLILKRLA